MLELCLLWVNSHCFIYTVVVAGALIAVYGEVNEEGFYRASFQGKTGLIPAGFVQEMEIEDSQQRKRLMNQTLHRPLSPFSTSHGSPITPGSQSAQVLSPIHSTGKPV